MAATYDPGPARAAGLPVPVDLDTGEIIPAPLGDAGASTIRSIS